MRHNNTQRARVLEMYPVAGVDARSIASAVITTSGPFEFRDRTGKELPISGGSSGLAYVREKKPWKQTALIIDHPGPPATITNKILEFDRVFGVDTNSRQVGDERVSMSALVGLKGFRVQNAAWSCTFAPLGLFEVRGPKEDSEKTGWCQALLSLDKAGLLCNSKVLLVVDSHLGELRNIARRTHAIVDNYFLPESVWLAYASSDTPRESPLNL